MWSIEAWCASQTPSPWDHLDGASVQFLETINATAQHPFCILYNDSTYPLPGVPHQGPLLSHDHLESIWDVIVTTVYILGPSLYGMGELWLRLFASVIAPIGILYQVLWSRPSFKQDIGSSKPTLRQKYEWLVSVLTTASAVVLLTDTLYVLEFTEYYGMILLVVSVLVGTYQFPHTRWIQFACIALTAHLLYDPMTKSVTYGNPNDAVSIEEGLYYNNQSDFNQKLVQHWDESSYSFPTSVATPWFPTGDARTGLPFLLNKDIPNPNWVRMWLPSYDDEVVALDIAFPKVLDVSNKPTYLVLHGLNGGSEEEYVKEFTHRRLAEGSLVIVMVARGLMDLPIRSMNVFHGARWQDAHSAAVAVRAALGQDKMLAGVGYSMGAIILSNYVTRVKDCPLDAAVAVSGGLDMRQQIDFPRAQRLWHPILCKELRQTFVVGKWGERVKSRLSKPQLKHLMRATHVSEVDETAVVVYNGFDSLEQYYSEMSALGDIPESEYETEQLHPSRRIHNLSVPLLVVHAFDDPLVTWRSVAANQGLRHPGRLTKVNENLFVALTKRGGHVGWSTGWLPFVDKWKWMNEISKHFVNAVRVAKMSSS